MSTFTGFSEEDLKRIKSTESGPHSAPPQRLLNARKIDKIGARPKKQLPQYKLPLKNQNPEDAIDVAFDKCKLSLKQNSVEAVEHQNGEEVDNGLPEENTVESDDIIDNAIDSKTDTAIDYKSEEDTSRKSSTNVTPDVVRCIENYTEDDLVSHRVKLEELQLQQKLMEEQNKKRKEMLAKALADRTKQTEEEVQKLEKIKKELQVLDGQFSQDVAVLRKKIDQACLSYADAEKHYLKVEKEFLQAKISLQKEKERKELLTEHLCALITHNETRKAHKLETLMLELATNKNECINAMAPPVEDTSSVVIDGVDERTGKMVEILPES
ncbi:RAB6-interacting golgin [Maniola hyperantus]|uniref:RAB6-interacting golgin n=1 Tax=Aphantopus hyperantus TaxID=2795564 RepID=UPI0015682F41|nr:RAB6-interacting golgin [Maniola hyperantus]XP_034831367.1 RAB6-interacting golgin [Maniola hyperantus]